MNEPKVVVVKHEHNGGSIRTYTIGFVLSIVLTVAAYILTSKGTLSGWSLVYILGALAVAQLLVQLIFFLHMGRESRPRWNLTVALFAVMVVGILVFGTLWIMKNLQYSHTHQLTTPSQTDQLIIHDEGYGQ
ncbi:MAG TPA: cytochrome o ubiquinol oxidase subunit IV [Verrucomicrobiae bacterium]|nr:cytochrome o ubiquinol oxidase subunit IV [Verrucomicrobiae bacterium]